jgi:hypothetical protein
MTKIAGAIIQCETANIHGVVCDECDQIAFRVVEVNGVGNVRVVAHPCRRHYIDAQVQTPHAARFGSCLPPEQTA